MIKLNKDYRFCCKQCQYDYARINKLGIHSEVSLAKIHKGHPGLKGDLNPATKPEVRKKLRFNMINHIKNTRGAISPNIGVNEKLFLDELEKHLRIKILRQYYIDGYFVDGYIPKLNLVIEIDEDKHLRKKKISRDLERQRYIQNKLNCNFIRIADY